MGEKCAVCDGSGKYPVFDNRGVELYSITCPECDGDGDGRSLDEWLSDIKEAKFAAQQRAKYDAAMAEKRLRQTQKTPGVSTGGQARD